MNGQDNTRCFCGTRKALDRTRCTGCTWVTSRKKLVDGPNINFQSISFPIVRRVFGGLITNELVSAQLEAVDGTLQVVMDETERSQYAGFNNVLEYRLALGIE